MKTVLLETHNLKNPATGFGVFNYGLVKGLSHAELGDLSITLCIQKTPDIKTEFKNKFRFKEIFGFNRYKLFRVNKKYDLWHSVNQNTKIEPRRINKYLLTIHDVNFVESVLPDKNHKRYLAFLEKLHRAHSITYISEYAKKQTHQYFEVPDVPEYVIYNGNPITEILDTSTFTPTVPVDKPFFYSIGDFMHKKNFVSIVKMMAEFPETNLIISGNDKKPYGEEVRQSISDLNLEKRVFLTGKVDHVAKQYYMKNCDAFLFPSTGEGFGLPPIEAMRFGKPIFLSNMTSLPEIGGEHSFYWSSFDPKSMSETVQNGLQTYHSNKDFYMSYYKARADFFNWDDTAAKYLELYKSILATDR